MRKNFTSLLLLLTASLSATAQQTETPMPQDFTQGIIMLNEDWFGKASSSMNFIANDGNVYYNVYKTKNATHCLGNTAQYGDVFGDYLYVVSKQPYTSATQNGGRLVRINATTMEFVDEIVDLNGADGRSFCAVDENKGYIGTSQGIYTVDLTTMQVGTKQLVPAPEGTRLGQAGEMLRYGNRVFAVVQNMGVVVIDVNTDEAQIVDMPQVVAPVVTADGSLYWATADNNAEFVSMNPQTLETTIINIEGNHAIASAWFAWHKTALVADKNKNVVYYTPDAGWTITTVASYNFDTQEFIPSFVSAPGTADGAEYNSVFYGEGLSIDPATGNLTLVVKKDGWGNNSEFNKIYFFNPSTREFLQDKTITLKNYYWFPSMMIYPCFQAPEMAAKEIKLAAGSQIEVNLAEQTTLAVGNKNLVRYTVENNHQDVVTVSVDAFGKMQVNALADGSAQLSVTADYRGKKAVAVIDVVVGGTVGVESLESEVASAKADVFTTTGVCVLKNATMDQVQRTLPRGIYVFGKKKIMVK